MYWRKTHATFSTDFHTLYCLYESIWDEIGKIEKNEKIGMNHKQFPSHRNISQKFCAASA